MILLLETSTKNCSVALVDSGLVVAAKSARGDGFIHGEQLHTFIQETLGKAGISSKDLSAVAVGKGPGSFTGLRIGVSAAKGIAFAMNIPLISFNTLASFPAEDIDQEATHKLCVIDARRDEVYAALFTKEGSSWAPTGPVHAMIVTPESWEEALPGGAVVAVYGDCAGKVKQLKRVDSKHTWLYTEDSFPFAEKAANEVQTKYSAGEFEDVAYFEPFYLKDFQAEKSKKNPLNR